MISSTFIWNLSMFKWNHIGELNPKVELHRICTNNLQKHFFLFLLFLISYTNHLDEKVEAIHTADLFHTLSLVSVKLELKYTLITA